MSVMDTISKSQNISHFSLNEAEPELIICDDKTEVVIHRGDSTSAIGHEFLNKKRKLNARNSQNIVEKNQGKMSGNVNMISYL